MKSELFLSTRKVGILKEGGWSLESNLGLGSRARPSEVSGMETKMFRDDFALKSNSFFNEFYVCDLISLIL